MEKQDLYETLGVDRSATTDEIKRAYQKSSARVHPDKFTDPDEKAAAADEQQALNTAYDVLSDKDKREHYDKYGTTEELTLNAPEQLVAKVMIETLQRSPTCDVFHIARKVLQESRAKHEREMSLKIKREQDRAVQLQRTLDRVVKKNAKAENQKGVAFTTALLQSQIEIAQHTAEAQKAERGQMMDLYTEAIKLIEGLKSEEELKQNPWGSSQLSAMMGQYQPRARSMPASFLYQQRPDGPGGES